MPKRLIAPIVLGSLLTTSFLLGQSRGLENATEHGKAQLEQVQIVHTKEVNKLQSVLKASTVDVMAKDKELKQLRSERLSSRGGTSIPKLNTSKFLITAYSPLDDVNGINSDGDPHTATGSYPKPGTFAVDPDVIPYGSQILIVYPDGTQERGIAEDTGGAIAGKKGEKRYRIDVFRQTYKEAIAFGKNEATVIWWKE